MAGRDGIALQPSRNSVSLTASPARLMTWQSARADMAVDADFTPVEETKGPAERVGQVFHSADSVMRSWLADPKRPRSRSLRPFLRLVTMVGVVVLAAGGGLLALIAVGTN